MRKNLTGSDSAGVAPSVARADSARHVNKVGLARERWGKLHPLVMKRTARGAFKEYYLLRPGSTFAESAARKRLAELPSAPELAAQIADLRAAVFPEEFSEDAARWLVACLVEGLGGGWSADRIDFQVEVLRSTADEETGTTVVFSPEVLFSAVLKVGQTAQFAPKPSDLVRAAFEARAAYRSALGVTVEMHELARNSLEVLGIASVETVSVEDDEDIAW